MSDTSAHVCGACGGTYVGEQAYLEHVCERTGFAPSQIEHQDVMTDGRASQVAQSALERGAEKG